MTRKEAIKWLEETIQDTDTYWESCSEALQKELDEQKEVFLLALSALRPVSRERVEKLRGEWIPAESDFDDDDTLFDVEDWCDWQCSACHNEICYDDPMERRWLPKFCPNCGAPMTDEAVDMMLEKLEEMTNEPC